MRLMLKIVGVLVCFLFVARIPVKAQAAGPVITQINPTTVSAGGPAFSLTVMGGNFSASSVVQVNGSNRTTVFVSSAQLTATISASDITTAGSLAITVFDPTSGTGPSNTVTLTVSAALPTLTSVAPGFVTPGAIQVRMTLIGTNFVPGATVVISPPVTTVQGSQANVQATDISIDSVQYVSSNLLIALVSISPDATGVSSDFPTGLRAVDVVNPDGTSTGTSLGAVAIGSGTTQPLRLSAGSSLGAPLAVVTIAVTHPRNGTLVMQGDELYGEAILGGTGSGTVVGQWLWDGNVTEQFALPIAGGQRITLRSQRSFPTSFLGTHTLELRITQPNQILSRPVTVVVNPGDWQLQKLLGPAYGAGFATDAPPLLRWAPVPGAARYQVGFSRRPYFGSIEAWHDVDDNQWDVPRDVWAAQPEGELYWTVRAVETSGVTRKPAPLRRIFHFPNGALASASTAPARTAQGNPLLRWQGLAMHVFYRISVSEDAGGTHVLRRYLTGDPRLDLRALRGKLVPGQTYFWRVDAVSPDGSLVLTGPTASFVAPAGPQARGLQEGHLVLASLRTSRPGNAGTPAMPDIESEIVSRSPSPGTSVKEAKPVITIQFKSPVNPMTLALMVDDTDVTSLAQVADTQISYTPALALANGAHSVNLTIENEAASWKFTVEGQKAPPIPAAESQQGGLQSGTDAEAPPTAAAGAAPTKRPPAERPAAIIGPQMQTQVSSTTQWASGSAPDTNAVTFGQQMSFQDGKWRVEMNGSGLLNSVLDPETARLSHGLVNDYVLRTAYDAKPWGANIRFGVLSPALYLDSQFVTAATPRQGLEFTMNTPGGAFAYYVNTNDVALGGGSGISFHQQLMGASWQAPLPKKLAQFRLMWLSAKDVGSPTTVKYDPQGNPIVSANPFITPAAGDAYGGLLVIHLNPQWQWASEYAWSYDNANTQAPGAQRLFGRAWRTGVTGTIRRATLNIIYRDVGPNFGSPANPSLSALSNPDRRGVDASVSDPTRIGTISLGYSFLQSNINDVNLPEQMLHNFTEVWSKPLNPTTVISLNSHQTLTLTGTVPAAVLLLPADQQKLLEPDQRDVGANLSVTHQVSKVLLSLGGSRDWFRNNSLTGQNLITSSVLVGANWSGPAFFQLNSNFSVNWVAGDKTTVGGTRSISGYVQPTFIWQRANFQVAPLISVNTIRTELTMGMLTNDTLTGQYGGRVSWTMPSHLKFSTLSMEGDLTNSRNNLTNTEVRDVKVLGVWTLVWGRKIGF
jgi:hypothetical protein